MGTRPFSSPPKTRTEDVHNNPRSPQNLKRRGPDYFPDLENFMGCENSQSIKDVLSNEEFWECAARIQLDPGAIIYIKDPNTRINEQVMLVLRETKPSTLTCLSFCYHPDLVGQSSILSNHARALSPVTFVSSQPTSTSLSKDGLFPLEVNLGLQGHDHVAVRPDIYVNCEELWNIDREVKVLRLGEVKWSSFKKLVKEVIRIFCDSLEETIDSRNPLPAIAVPNNDPPPAKVLKTTTTKPRKNIF